MANVVDKVRIHNAILGLLQAGPYYAVTYTPATKLAGDIDPADPVAPAAAITPASCQTNEIGASFEEAGRHGRGYALDRDHWTWIGIVKFHQEVTVHEAEEAWQTSPLILPRSDVFRQATIKLTSTSYEHPTRQESHSGSRIEFNFDVRLSRR